MKTFEYKIYVNGKSIEFIGYAFTEDKMREILITKYGANIQFEYLREKK